MMRLAKKMTPVAVVFGVAVLVTVLMVLFIRSIDAEHRATRHKADAAVLAACGPKRLKDFEAVTGELRADDAYDEAGSWVRGCAVGK